MPRLLAPILLIYRLRILTKNVVLTSDYQQAYSSANTYQYKKSGSEPQAGLSSVTVMPRTDLEIRVRYANNVLNTALVKYTSLSKSRDLASEAYRLAELRYEAGTRHDL